MDLSKLSDKQLLEYKHRLEYDVSEFDTIQNALKITMNSAYGTLGQQYFRYFDIRLAEGVTKTGQLIIRTLEEAINKKLNQLSKTEKKDYIIASDTDSLIFTLEKIVDNIIPKEKQKNIDTVINFMDKVCEDYLQPIISETCEYLKEYLNCHTQTLKMKREILSDVAIWTTKKRYVMSVRDKENVRYSEPKLKIMGLEAIRSSTPTICRDSFKECIKVALYEDEHILQSKILEFKEQFKKQRPEDIAFPKSVNDLEKYQSKSNIYIKGSPVQVKAALVYNHKIKELNLLDKYSIIQSGDKLKYLYLTIPNPFKSSVIGFSDELPMEFNLLECIDYDKHFEISFLKPIKSFLDYIDWNVEKKFTLKDFLA